MAANKKISDVCTVKYISRDLPFVHFPILANSRVRFKGREVALRIAGKIGGFAILMSNTASFSDTLSAISASSFLKKDNS